MARIVYCRPSDIVTANATITASAEDPDPNYGNAALCDGDPAKPAKLTTTSGNWVCDFGAPQVIKLAALIHHNLDAGLEVRLQGNASNVWTSPSFNQVITIPAKQAGPVPQFTTSPFMDLTTLAGYSGGGYRYWRLVVVGVNSETIQVGEFVLSAELRVVEINVSWGGSEAEDHPVVEHRTDHGVAIITVIGVRLWTLVGEMDTTEVGWLSIRELSRDAMGKSLPWLLIADPDVNEAQFVRFIETKHARILVFLDRNTVAFAVEALSKGLPL